jgi:hypothetical protein
MVYIYTFWPPIFERSSSIAAGPSFSASNLNIGKSRSRTEHEMADDPEEISACGMWYELEGYEDAYI